MAYVTRSGRTVKKPDLYEPEEICEDDYSDSEGEGEEDIFADEESESDEEDADENGNLKGFVVSDDDDDSDEEA